MLHVGCGDIMSANTNARISFEYDAVPGSSMTFASNDYVVLEDKTDVPGQAILTEYWNGQVRTTHYSYGNAVTTSNVLPSQYSPGDLNLASLDERKLRKIIFDGGTVSFYRTDQLSSIVVRDQSGNTIRVIELFISPYATGSIHTIQTNCYLWVGKVL